MPDKTKNVKLRVVAAGVTSACRPMKCKIEDFGDGTSSSTVTMTHRPDLGNIYEAEFEHDYPKEASSVNVAVRLSDECDCEGVFDKRIELPCYDQRLTVPSTGVPRANVNRIVSNTIPIKYTADGCSPGYFVVTANGIERQRNYIPDLPNGFAYVDFEVSSPGTYDVVYTRESDCGCESRYEKEVVVPPFELEPNPGYPELVAESGAEAEISWHPDGQWVCIENNSVKASGRWAPAGVDGSKFKVSAVGGVPPSPIHASEFSFDQGSLGQTRTLKINSRGFAKTGAITVEVGKVSTHSYYHRSTIALQLLS